MAEYTLKPGQDKFQVVDGPYAGKKYKPGMVYNEIPPEEAGRFDEVLAATQIKRFKAEKKEGEES